MSRNFVSLTKQLIGIMAQCPPFWFKESQPSLSYTGDILVLYALPEAFRKQGHKIKLLP